MEVDNYFFSFKLVLRLYISLIWIVFFIIIISFGIGLNILAFDTILWTDLLILSGIYFTFYLLWGIVYLVIFKRSLKFCFPFIPWFGIMPKNILSFKEYKRFEISYLIFFWLSFLWVIILIPDSIKISFLSFYFLLFIYRIIIFIRIIRLKNPKYYIKYNSTGISIYKTDF